ARRRVPGAAQGPERGPRAVGSSMESVSTRAGTKLREIGRSVQRARVRCTTRLAATHLCGLAHRNERHRHGHRHAERPWVGDGTMSRELRAMVKALRAAAQVLEAELVDDAPSASDAVPRSTVARKAGTKHKPRPPVRACMPAATKPSDVATQRAKAL